MKKRLLSLLLALCMALAMVPVSAQAEEATSGSWGNSLTWELDENRTLTISGTGEMPNVTDDNPAPYKKYKDHIKQVIIKSGVTSIGDRAFCDYTGWPSLTIITIPDSVTSIGDEAFWGCIGLTEVKIPDSVTSIGDSAFEHCEDLTSITIPDSVASIGVCAFSSCFSLTGFVAPENADAKYVSVDGVLFDKQKSTLICYPGGKPDTSYIIPDSVTSIGDGAFSSCFSLTEVEIPDSVTSIGVRAFDGCSGLTSIAIPEKVTSIKDEAFYGCSGLTSIAIPDGVTSIGDYAFYRCSGLTSITIPDSVTSIGDSAFRWCGNLEDVYYAGDESQWKGITIERNNDPLTSADIHYNSTAPTTTYTITFDSNGGSAVADATVKDGEKVTKPAPDPAKEGHTFKGWYTDEGCTTAYDFAAPVKGNLTLYAGWTQTTTPPAQTYTITFNANDGTTNPHTEERTTNTDGELLTDDIPIFTREGYIFGGWYTEDGDHVYPDAMVFTEDKELFAHWTKSITGVSLNTTKLSLTVNGSETLAATVEPADATDTRVTWTSSDESVATVSSSGVVTAVAVGTATITATTTDGSKTASCEVTVTAQTEATKYVVHVENPANGTISPDKTDAAAGETVTLTVTPAEGYQLKAGSLSVTDDSGTAVTVSGSGNSYTFTMPAGNVTITAEFQPLSATETGVVLDKTELSLTEDGTADLKATVTSEDAGTVTWSVSPEGIVELKTDGNTVTVTAKKAGSATITASIGGKTASCTVTVTETAGPKKTYTVNFNANDGTVTPTSMTTDEDGKLTAKLPTPTRKGYTFIGWFTEKENGENVPDDKAFTADTTLYAHWTQTPAQKYKLTVTNGTAGGKTSGEYPAEAEVTITADAAPDGKIFDKWTTNNGGSFASDTSASTKFTMPAADVTVTATYKDAQTAADSTDPADHLYNIYLPNVAGGVVTASTLSSYAGVYVPLTVYPNRGYELEIIFLVDGAGSRIPVSYSGGQYWFLMPSSNVTVYAYFVPTASNTAPVTSATTSRPMVSSAPETPPLAINIFASKTGNVGRVSYSVDFSLSATATGGDGNYSYQFEIKQRGTLTRSTGWIGSNVFSGFISGSGPCVAEITVKDSSGKAVRTTVDVLTGKTITPAEQVSVPRA